MAHLLGPPSRGQADRVAPWGHRGRRDPGCTGRVRPPTRQGQGRHEDPGAPAVGGGRAGCVLLLGLVVRQLHGQGLAHAIRDHSLLWPCISWARDPGRGPGAAPVVPGQTTRRAVHARPSNNAGLVGAVVLFAVECAFLLTAVPHLWSSSTQIFATTPAERQLQILAGDQRVGFGQCPKPVQLAPLGILPEPTPPTEYANWACSTPSSPRLYLPTYARLSHTPVVKPVLGNFCRP